jgi:hypothetical protein
MLRRTSEVLRKELAGCVLEFWARDSETLSLLAPSPQNHISLLVSTPQSSTSLSQGPSSSRQEVHPTLAIGGLSSRSKLTHYLTSLVFPSLAPRPIAGWTALCLFSTPGHRCTGRPPSSAATWESAVYASRD